jgi:hypothetical protein
MPAKKSPRATERRGLFYATMGSALLLLLSIVVLPSRVLSLSMNPVTSRKNSKSSVGSGDSLSSYNIHTPTAVASDWHKFCPSIWPSTKKTIDVTVTWTRSDSFAPDQAARAMLHQMDPLLPPSQISALADVLSSYLLDFSDFCQENFETCPKFKARIVATRGSSGTRCPQWHIDHVPVRWIQALAGPGCELVMNQDGVNWNAVNSLDATFDSVEARNQFLVDPEVTNIYSAKEQEVALLVGNRWNECCKEGFEKQKLNPVVHRSPTSIPMWQGRLLLTQDVIIDQ